MNFLGEKNSRYAESNVSIYSLTMCESTTAALLDWFGAEDGSDFGIALRNLNIKSETVDIDLRQGERVDDVSDFWDDPTIGQQLIRLHISNSFRICIYDLHFVFISLPFPLFLAFLEKFWNEISKKKNQTSLNANSIPHRSIFFQLTCSASGRKLNWIFLNQACVCVRCALTTRVCVCNCEMPDGNIRWEKLTLFQDRAPARDMTWDMTLTNSTACTFKITKLIQLLKHCELCPLQ